MEKKGLEAMTGALIFIAFLMLGGLFFVFISSDWAGRSDSNGINATKNAETCVNLGCSSSTILIGDASTKFYYFCVCQEAGKINVSNRVCFESKKEIGWKNYYKGYCTS